ncbi:hypothetical protein AbraIFM66951_005576 [Aspergillus brasiliensis]|uniref:Uncharacterized protein n=1 Tax=Aspergillus brasiliensis TaxID=319629 RepID=A0A9W5YNB7_9EURO|nr:hypothetical protein AbraCBS73388_003677 [Aspergillus brasiliensis]GKZ43921.1 hypothetical protein AbraIFM66951_005576 [Aspergillus brasiliensis]
MSSTPTPVPGNLPNIPPSSLCVTYPYTSPNRMRRLYYDTDPNKTPYLHFTNVPHTLITQSLELDRFVQTKARITYDYPSRTLIMKGGSRRLEFAKGLFETSLSGYRYATGLRRGIIPCGAATVAEGDVVKEPDLSWYPRNLPPGQGRKWPHMVLHVGWPEGLEYLRREAKLWLEWSKGDVKTVVLMDIGEKEMGIEKWVTGDEGPQMVQRVLVRKTENGLAALNAPFVMTFQELFLRDPDPEKPQEKDWVLDVEQLGEYLEFC